MCTSMSVLQEQCTKIVSYVHDVLCPGVQTTLVTRFQQIHEINAHWQGEIDHNIFFMLLYVQKSRTILIRSLACQS